MDIYEDARTVSRADLAAWLRQVASQLEAGQLFYGAAGTIAVADQVHCELEIEQEDKDEFSVEIEFSWINPKATPTETPAGAEKTTAAEAPVEVEKAADHDADDADEEPAVTTAPTA